MNDLDFSQNSEGEMVRLYAEYLLGIDPIGLYSRMLEEDIWYSSGFLTVEDISHFGMDT